MKKEVWKPIKGCEGRYYISSQGRVKSTFRGKERILKPSISNWGYLRVRITTNSGKRISPRIHRLVAEAFIPNPEHKKEVNHLSGDKLDNRVENLCWTTPSENKQHSIDKLGVKPWGLPVRRIRCVETGEEYCSVSYASKITGISRTQLGEHLKRRRKHAGGLHWEYVD